MHKILKVHQSDDVIVALQDLTAGEEVSLNGRNYTLLENITAKHKFAAHDFAPGDPIHMYGVKIGRAVKPIHEGMRISTENTEHDTNAYQAGQRRLQWDKPDISRFKGRTFKGYHREDGRVGTMNYWLVVPMVFCENRNIQLMKESMLPALGYVSSRTSYIDLQPLLQAHRKGAATASLLEVDILSNPQTVKKRRPFPNVDGIKFLTHDGGCGGTRQDSEMLCRLLAGYIDHPNVAGATVLSLGCQNAQVQVLEKALRDINPSFNKPLYVFEQQQYSSEQILISQAIKQTFSGLVYADQFKRKKASLKHLKLGLECGGSDGFSGISANPALGYASDLLVALGGTAVLSEFPELNGVEQELADRCVSKPLAEKFVHLMDTYNDRAKAVGSAFSANPSPGNIKDGLITDAMKSAGAARKGGNSPVTDVLDYGEQVVKPGLNLLCTPGNDVESTTGLAGSGANVIAFTTGLGTPTGNPIAPVVKIASNTKLAQRMSDIIDIDAGSIITGEDTIASMGEAILDYVIRVAGGEAVPHAVQLGQDDFIPWKRGVSL